ncbi:hypothetical protein [Roseomonas harenae]|uniref:hypothetical protein n=1 Tax=Muricoccus harenae TaxID=2692566 RepID=UPI0013313F7F|nr:hypothetical protein [Roseomonas harenae]
MRRLLPLLLLPWFIAPAMAQAPANSWRVVNRTGQEATRLVALEPGTTPARTRNRLREPVADGAEKRFRRKAGTPLPLRPAHAPHGRAGSRASRS